MCRHSCQSNPLTHFINLSNVPIMSLTLNLLTIECHVTLFSGHPYQHHHDSEVCVHTPSVFDFKTHRTWGETCNGFLYRIRLYWFPSALREFELGVSRWSSQQRYRKDIRNHANLYDKSLKKHDTYHLNISNGFYWIVLFFSTDTTWRVFVSPFK